MFTGFIVIGFLAVTGMALGVFLALSSIFFRVHKDPKLEQIEEALPGSNCGACGFPGCNGLAEAIFKEEAEYDKCPVGGGDTANIIAGILGKDTTAKKVKNVAHVHCQGFGEKISDDKFIYIGIDSCLMADKTAGGSKACSYGCLSLGDCVEACKFDALKINQDGKPTVDLEKCTGCGLCVTACPRNIISLIGIRKKAYAVSCKSKDKGAISKKLCNVSCIACKLCVKACKFDAIVIKDNLAIIDQEKCKYCGACIKVCPQNTIEVLEKTTAKVSIPKKQDSHACVGCGTCK